MTPDEVRTAERLRREMDGCVTDLRIPPSLISGTLRRHRWRLRRRRTALIAGPLAVAGAAAGLVSVLAAGGVNPPRVVTPPVRLTASYVIIRTVHSLSAGSGQPITEVRGAGPGSLHWIQWTDQATGRRSIEWLGQDGRPANEAVLTSSGSKFQVTYIDFRQKTWTRTSYSQPQVPSAPSAGHAFQSLPLDRAGFQAAISSGRAVIAGYQSVEGTDTIRLRITSDDQGPSRLTQVWISRATYLPVRISIVSTDPDWTVTEGISWLQRSRGNLRRFTVSIPPGFVQVRHSLPGRTGGGQG